MSRMKFRDYNGVEVSIDDSSGEFTAEVDGTNIVQPTYERMKIAIEDAHRSIAKAVKLALPCWGLLSTGYDATLRYSVIPLTLEGLNRNDSSMKFREHYEGEIGRVIPSGEDNGKLLTEYAEALNDQNRLEAELRGRTIIQNRWGGRIQATKYAEEIKRLRERYDEAVKGIGGQLYGNDGS